MQNKKKPTEGIELVPFCFLTPHFLTLPMRLKSVAPVFVGVVVFIEPEAVVTGKEGIAKTKGWAGNGGIGSGTRRWQRQSSVEDTSDVGVADLLFFGGPSPSKNECWLAMPTNPIIPSGRGRLFFLNRRLSFFVYGRRWWQRRKSREVGRGWEL